MILYMYIAVGQVQTTHWGQSFDVNRKALSLWLFVTDLKKSLQPLILCTFFMILYMYTAQGKVRKPIGDTIFMSTERPYHFGHLLQDSHCPFVASFKNISLNSDFINIFSCFYTCI